MVSLSCERSAERGREKTMKTDNATTVPVNAAVHSPGPFTCAGGGYIAIRDANGLEIARVSCWNTRRIPDDATCEANAALFMSAPELRGLARSIVAAWDGTWIDDSEADPEWKAIYESAKRLI